MQTPNPEGGTGARAVPEPSAGAARGLCRTAVCAASPTCPVTVSLSPPARGAPGSFQEREMGLGGREKWEVTACPLPKATAVPPRCHPLSPCLGHPSIGGRGLRGDPALPLPQGLHRLQARNAEWERQMDRNEGGGVKGLRGRRCSPVPRPWAPVPAQHQTHRTAHQEPPGPRTIPAAIRARFGDAPRGADP